MRDCHIFVRFYKALVKRFSEQFSIQFGKRFNKPTYAIDSTAITVCMKLFPWAKYKSTKGGLKLHTALDLVTGLPAVMNMTEARLHDSKAVRKIIRSLPPFSVVVMDRGYNDYELFGDQTDSGVTFVTSLKRSGPELLQSACNRRQQVTVRVSAPQIPAGPLCPAFFSPDPLP